VPVYFLICGQSHICSDFKGQQMRVRRTRPRFIIHRRWLSQKCCITARWDDGFSLAVRSFAEKSSAEQWLATEAHNWLEHNGFLQKFA
jgi:hypothetical protein